ncbi:hypothetical protein F5884DRAFT_788517 [Xylogone sp. PMI_703]|nr:hypothetical protein F5884DRAFT_788517 [Xylogone sp. PMI_703]
MQEATEESELLQDSTTANILLHPKETKNKGLYVASVIATQNDILSAVTESRPDIKLTIEKRDLKSSLVAAWEADKAGRSDQFKVIQDFAAACLYKIQN